MLSFFIFVRNYCANGCEKITMWLIILDLSAIIVNVFETMSKQVRK